MIMINDDHSVVAMGKDVEAIDVVTDLFTATSVMLRNIGCNDRSKFHMVSSLFLGGERIHKIADNPKLHEQVDTLLNEVWGAVEVVNKFIDESPTKE